MYVYMCIHLSGEIMLCPVGFLEFVLRDTVIFDYGECF